MSNLTTQLDLLTVSQASKEVTANGLFDAMSPAALFGRRPSTSGGLAFGLYGGVYRQGGVPTLLANQVLTLAASTTTYVLETGGVVTQTTVLPTGWPGTLGNGGVALYRIVTGATTVTDYFDFRASFGQAPGKRIFTPVWAATIAINWNLYDLVRVTLTGNTAFTFSGGIDGQSCEVHPLQDAVGGRTGTWPASVRFSTSVPTSPLTVTPSQRDKYVFQYNALDVKYDIEQINKGFA